jgi:hypothetical protein
MFSRGFIACNSGYNSFILSILIQFIISVYRSGIISFCNSGYNSITLFISILFLVISVFKSANRKFTVLSVACFCASTGFIDVVCFGAGVGTVGATVVDCICGVVNGACGISTLVITLLLAGVGAVALVGATKLAFGCSVATLAYCGSGENFPISLFCHPTIGFFLNHSHVLASGSKPTIFFDI